jgi:mannose/fructose/N-acetylgalactosamine-specific phosphotransferase system component IIC
VNEHTKQATQTQTPAEADVLLERVAGASAKDKVIESISATIIVVSLKRVKVDEGEAAAAVGLAVVTAWFVVANTKLLVATVRGAGRAAAGPT